MAQNIYSIGAVSLSVNQSKQITTYLSPETATSPISYESLDETIATVDDNGNVTAVSEGSTKILVKCAGLITKVDVIIGDAKYVMNYDNASEMYISNDPYTASVGGHTWSNSGRFGRTSYNGGFKILICDSSNTTLKTMDEITGVSKIAIAVVSDSLSYNYWVMNTATIFAGTSSEDCVEIKANQQGVAGEDSGKTNDYGNHLYKYMATFDIPSGCTYFAIRFDQWTVMDEIAFF